ncbi:Zn-dependent oxidoreductase [Stakelama sp. CBK3Z-3]|uniref:Zn-dependent oxidoreductase n=1 Tax=Stakelama flava TaxID=2860338 RepID=A0ABS6XKN6_9SPHN|nr:Zn-dependent oxidoreductase [Stakelama flava]MBW4330770.1 Zn-dependent oxidoreductase [Stakelama flava]
MGLRAIKPVGSRRNNADEGAYRTHCALFGHMTAAIPDDVSFAQAAALPLAIATAACGLFQRDFLGLASPGADAIPKSEIVIVWGASTSVGSNAVLLARAAGYRVIATAGPVNFSMVENLGAESVFDYADPASPSRMTEALRGSKVAGAVAIGQGSSKACIDILAKSEGNRFVAQGTTPASFENIPAGSGHWSRLLPVMAQMAGGSAKLKLRAARKGVKSKFIWGTALIDNEVGPAIFQDFLPVALKDGYCARLPGPMIAGTGLDAVPAALELRRAGVRASKVVVEL